MKERRKDRVNRVQAESRRMNCINEMIRCRTKIQSSCKFIFSESSMFTNFVTDQSAFYETNTFLLFKLACYCFTILLMWPCELTLTQRGALLQVINIYQKVNSSFSLSLSLSLSLSSLFPLPVSFHTSLLLSLSLNNMEQFKKYIFGRRH